MSDKLKDNEKFINIEQTDKKGKVIGTVKRVGKLVKFYKYSTSKYKYKVKVAPKTYIFLEDF